MALDHLLKDKGNEVWWISPDASVFDAIKEMANRETGALMVMDGDRLVGIVSERDYARKVILTGRSSKDTPVRDIMTTDLIKVKPSDTVEHCMIQLAKHHIRHLPVCDGDRVYGMVSIDDVVRAMVHMHESAIGRLEAFMTGER